MKHTNTDSKETSSVQRLARKRGPLKLIALIIGILIIVFGAFGAILGEVLGGVIIMAFGVLPAIYGFKKPGRGFLGKSANADELYYQNLAHEIPDGDSGDTDVDFSFD